MRFYIGLHQPSDAVQFERCMVSVNRLRRRKSDFTVGEWIMDSGAFTEVTTHGGYRHEPAEYAEHINRWRSCGNMVAAVSQDYMCEPFALERTGMTVEQHQELTLERYVALRAACPAAYVMPVLQGYKPADYVRHIRQYGNRLPHGAWVGVGSVCKRNSKMGSIEDVLLTIRQERPDLRLHGFGIKLTALQSSFVRAALYSADSMAWSWHARRNGRSANDWREAAKYCEAVSRQRPTQHHLFT